MPEKYHVHVKPTPPRFAPVAKISAFELEGCLGCLQCVKRDSCIYDVYQKRKFDAARVVTTGDSMCVNCMRCVQECKKGILTRAINPQFERMGDHYWKPDIITTLWKQSETGSIPVSGAGYRGPFSGPGFDQIWTDMSEIVRPTRDGIHGREYISTTIDLGGKPAQLEFDDNGRLLTQLPPLVESPLPILFDIPPLRPLGPNVRRAMAQAAQNGHVLAVATAEESAGILAEYRANLIVKLAAGATDFSMLEGVSIAELPFHDTVLEDMARIKKDLPNLVLAVRLALDDQVEERASLLVREGAEILILQADRNGQGFGRFQELFITELLRKVHMRLVEDGTRDQTTLLAAGGVALAEHVTKSILCGADGVFLDLVLTVALECRLCWRCQDNHECPVSLDEVDEAYGAYRITNLVGAFHSQLIEMMGAMGLREVRRLRGEVGRAMFMKDLEASNFAPLFGTRRPQGQGEAMPPVAPQDAPLPNASFHLLADQVRPMKSRYRNALPQYRVVRTSACISCGKCAEVCSYGVHKVAGKTMLAPVSRHCRGEEFCKAQGAFCGDSCPAQALVVGPDPSWRTFGDPRWPAELLTATWIQAETGRPPDMDLEYRVGRSGGGLDRMVFNFPSSPPDTSFGPNDVDLTVPLNRRTDDGRPPVEIGMPVYGGGMSYGSVSDSTMASRASAYTALNSFTCTGEGGYPDALIPYDDHVITQVATGLFGVREETIQRVRIVEFKYAQGAKPGLGGHLLGDKVTSAVAKMREAVQGSSLFSPFPFHSVYSVEDHKKHVDWIKQVNPKTLVSVKVSTPSDVDMVAVGSYYAGAHIVHLDGSYGGTGAAPDIAKKNIAMPIEYAIPMVHNFLVEEGIRDKITLISSGGLRSAWDVAKAIALGADAVVTGTADLVALECIRCTNCESGRGCARGIATTDPALFAAVEREWAHQRLVNLFHSWAIQLQHILWRLGMRSVRELVGRSEVLRHLDYDQGEQEQ